MKIALAQLNSADSVENNLKTILKLIDEAIEQPVKPALIVFPENSLFFRINTSDPVLALGMDSEVWRVLEAKAKEAQIALHLTTALKDQDNKVYNGSVLIDSNGRSEIVYRKVHLFDIALSGQRAIRESDVFAGGSAPSTFTINEIKFGSSVCYDVRFSELFAVYARQEVDVILVPSAFLVKTGLAHWDVLLRARAIESQCYVLAPAQVGLHKSTVSSDQRETYGNTLAIGPWGDILQKNVDLVGLIYVEVNKQAIADVRSQIPMRSHRKL